MKEIILCKYGEIALKGLNKSSFESMMTKSVKRRLKSCGQFSVSKAQSTLYVEPLNDDSDVDMAVEKLSKIFGIVKLCRCCVLEKDMDEILTKSLDYIEDEMETARTFKVDAKRSDKKFPFKSPEICIEMGGKILERFPHLKVDVHDPDVVVTVEIRETNAYVHAGSIEGAGGIPVMKGEEYTLTGKSHREVSAIYHELNTRYPNFFFGYSKEHQEMVQYVLHEMKNEKA